MGESYKKYFHWAHLDREALESLQQSVYPRQMDTQQQSERKRREEILSFWKAHGLTATEDAFGVCRRTLYYWQNDPTPKSRAHREGYSKRQIPPEIASEIIRIRNEHPHLGKEKLTPLLRRFCEAKGLPVSSEPTVGRMIAQLKAEGRLKAPVSLRMNARTGELREKLVRPKEKKLRRGSYLPLLPGGLLQIDGVMKIILGKRRYVFTAVDVVSRVSFSCAYPSASSRNGKDFLARTLAAMPFAVSHIQTDNGSEFLKDFRKAAIEAELTHFFNWVKQPKYQGWIERFNRSVQAEFVDWHLDLLATDLDRFNTELEVWTTWYNGERVHRGLNRKTPQGVQKYTPLQYLALTAECKAG